VTPPPPGLAFVVSAHRTRSQTASANCGAALPAASRRAEPECIRVPGSLQKGTLRDKSGENRSRLWSLEVVVAPIGAHPETSL